MRRLSTSSLLDLIYGTEYLSRTLTRTVDHEFFVDNLLTCFRTVRELVTLLGLWSKDFREAEWTKGLLSRIEV